MHRHQKIQLWSFLLLLLIQPGFNTVQQYHLQRNPNLHAEEIYRDTVIPIPTEVTLPVFSNQQQPPFLSARAAMVIDRASGAILYAKNPDESLYPASLTKVMTAIVAMENLRLEEEVVIQDESEAIGNTIKLEKGERITVGELMKGLLIASGNDAAFALANRVPGGYDAFIQKMNDKAKELHMENTTYLNVSGVEQEGHLTSVRDMATLTKYAMDQEWFREIVRIPSTTITSADGLITHELVSTNQLLGQIDGIEGVKTGWTTQAGECLITQTTRDGHTIITVVLGSQDRFGESASLIRWAYGSHDWKHYRFEDWLGLSTAGT